MIASRALLAYRRGDDSEDAEVGALLEAEHYLLIRSLIEGLAQAKR